MENVWLNQGTKYKHKIIRLRKGTLYYKYDNSWKEVIHKPDLKMRTYKKFKTSPIIENYLQQTKDVNVRKEFTKLQFT